MADKKITVSVDFIAEGLDKIKQGVDKASSNLSSKSSKKEIELIKKEMSVLNKIIEDSSGEVSNATYTAMVKTYSDIIKKYDGLRKDLIKPLDSVKSAKIGEIQESTNQLEKEIEELREGLRSSKQSKLKPSGELTKKFSQELFEETTKDKGLVSYSKTGLVTTKEETADITTEKINEALEKQQILKTRIKEIDEGGKELTEGEKIALETILSSTGLKLTAEQALEHLATDKIIQAEKIKTIEEERLKQVNDEKSIQEKILEIETKTTEQEQIQEELGRQVAAQGGEGDESVKLSAEIFKSSAELRETARKKHEEYLKSIEKGIPIIKQETQAQEKNAGAFANAAKNVISYSAVYGTLRRVYRETIRTITELDKSMTQMSIVTSMTRKEAWNLVPAMQDLAKATGFATTEVAQITTEYLKQGKTIQDAMILTEVAAKAARIGAISAADSVQYLTAAVNGFNLEAEDAIVVSDKFAALAASSATDYEELAVGLSKFAAQANIAGLSMDYALGLLAKGLETTREAPESIGTALKTVLARMRELTDLGKTMEDGMDVNRVETALRQVGVELMDTNGMFRSMEDVLDDVGRKWDTLNSNQQASVAVSLAGTRQQSRLLAMFQNYDRTLELVDESQQSAGATAAQHLDYMLSMEAALTGLKTSWQAFITAITETELIIGIVNILSKLVNVLTTSFEMLGNVGQFVLYSVLALAGGYKILNVLMGIHSLFVKEDASSMVKYLKKGWARLAQMKSESIERKKEIAEKAGIIVANKVVEATTDGVIVAKTVETKSVWLSVKAWFAQLMILMPVLVVVLAITAAVILVTVVIVALIKVFKKQKKSAAEISAGFEKQKLEITKLINEYDKLIDKIEELNNKPIKTEEDIKALKGFQEQLEELQESSAQNKEMDFKFKVVYFEDGTVDWNKTTGNLNEFLNYEKEERAKKSKEAKDALLKENFKGNTVANNMQSRNEAIPFGSKKTSMYKTGKQDGKASYREVEEFEKVLDGVIRDKDAQRIHINAWASEYGELNEETNSLFYRFFENMFEEIDNVEMLAIVMGDGSVQLEAVAEYIKEVQSTNEKIELSESSNESYKIFTEKINEIEKAIKELDGDNSIEAKQKIQALNFTKQQLELSNGVLGMVRKVFGERTDVEIDLFKSITNDSLDSISESIRKSMEGRSIEDINKARDKFFKDAEAEYSKLISNGMDESVAKYTTWSNIALTINDATLKAELFNLAMKGTNQSLAFSADTLKSKIKGLEEAQSKFIKGELSDSEIYDYMNGHPDLFGDEEFFNRFIQGKDVSSALYDEEIKQYKDYIQQISGIDAQIKKAKMNNDLELIKTLQGEKNQILALITYRGELSKTNKVQYEYNKNLEIYNNYKKLGIDNLEVEAAFLKSMYTDTIKQTINATEEIEYQNELIQEKFGKSADHYYETVGGVVRITQAARDELNSIQIEALEDFINIIQAQNNIILDSLFKLRDQEIKIEKDKLDRLKKIYEDYFKDLDRLEEKRDRKQSREDIIKQLQRLEGATDEMSKKKAKDLKASLIKMEEDGAKKDREEGRKALLDSMNTDELETKWNDIIFKLIKAGGESAESFYNTLMGNFSVNREELSGWTSEQETSMLEAHERGDYDEFERLKNEKHNILKIPKVSPYMKEKEEIQMQIAWAESDGDYERLKIWKDKLRGIRGYAKGGLVDQTGLAMLHGSLSGPEAVLSARQTEMFLGLRDALSNMSSGENKNNNNLVIENITINTKSMDSKQDFNSAGQELAKAFSNAINKNGLTLNTKR